jgi:formylglycine-generating enzyme required for sulfatase activity
MNGSGRMVWENVFGTWNGWCPRDRSILRCMLPIQRRHAAIFCGEGWTPLVATERQGVYASLWEGGGLRLWTLVNRGAEEVRGDLIRIQRKEGERIFDLVAGAEAASAASAESGEIAVVSGTIRPRGIGCLVAGKLEALGKDFPEFLAGQAALRERTDWSTGFPAIRAEPVAARTVLLPEPEKLPEDMVAIPAASFRMKITFRARECGFHESTPAGVIGSGIARLHQPVTFERDVELGPYAMDLTPVTNARFHEFLRATGYEPEHRERFLAHWTGGKPPAGREDHPVVYVDLDDARAFARWAGRRLPTEEEWQHAAAGPKGLKYPWGDEMLAGRANGGETGGTTPVKAFPEGRSPFGCHDMCGNVWEWTESERSDGRTRFCIIRGGSYYRAVGSDWYMDGGPRPNDFACKFLLHWPGLDRCGTIGFRCAVSLPRPTPRGNPG